MKKNSSFDDLSKSVERLVKKRESGTMENYKLSYRRLRNKLQMIYSSYEREDGVNISKRELRKLDKETAKIMIDMYWENKKATENTLKDIFDKAFETVNNSTEKYNIEAVSRNIDPTKVINKEIAGHIWTERIDKYGSDFIYDVHGIIHQGMTNGETFTSMAKKLRDRFGKDIGNTVRIARTEGARVLEDSKFESMKGIAENESVQVFKVWHTMGDEAVRDTHIAMEGVKVPYDEEFVLPSGARCLYPKDTGVPSEDINCRCYVEYVTETVYNKDIDEIARLNGYEPLESSKVVNTLRNDSKLWINDLTDDEIKAINKYTFNGVDPDGKRLFEKINGYLEGRYEPVNSEEKEVINKIIYNIKNGLLKNTLTHDIIVYRYDKDVKNIGGQINRFLSTSVTKRGVLGGKPNGAIIIPKGTIGAYIEKLAHDDFKNQREFLLNGGFSLKKIANNGLDIYIVKE